MMIMSINKNYLNLKNNSMNMKIKFIIYNKKQNPEKNIILDTNKTENKQ